MAKMVNERPLPNRTFIDLTFDSAASDSDSEQDSSSPAEHALQTTWRARPRRPSERPLPLQELQSQESLSQENLLKWRPRKQNLVVLDTKTDSPGAERENGDKPTYNSPSNHVASNAPHRSLPSPLRISTEPEDMALDSATPVIPHISPISDSSHPSLNKRAKHNHVVHYTPSNLFQSPKRVRLSTKNLHTIRTSGLNQAHDISRTPERPEVEPLTPHIPQRGVQSPTRPTPSPLTISKSWEPLTDSKSSHNQRPIYFQLRDEILKQKTATNDSIQSTPAPANVPRPNNSTGPVLPPSTQDVPNGGEHNSRSQMLSNSDDSNAITSVRLSAIGYLDKYSSVPLSQKTRALTDEVSQLVTQYLGPWCIEENALLIHAKEELQLKWSDIYSRFFRHRGSDWHGCQVQYSTRLAVRPRGKKSTAARHREDSPSDETPTRTNDHRFLTSRQQSVRFQNVYRSDELSSESRDMDHASKTRKQARRTRSLNQTFIAPSLSIRDSGYLSRLKRWNERQRTLAALASATVKIMPNFRPVTGILQPNVTQHSLSRSWKTQSRRNFDVQRPYLTFDQRNFLKTSANKGYWRDGNIEWENQILHVDFTESEIRRLADIVFKVTGQNDLATPRTSTLEYLSRVLKPANEQQIHKIVRHAQANGGIGNRTVDSLQGFIQDLVRGRLNITSVTDFIGISESRDSSTSICTNSALRTREIGGLKSTVRISSKLQARLEDTFGPYLSFTGCSGDVNAVAWAPDGERFGVASTALTDAHSMQYNVSNNLLFGSLLDKRLIELPHHASKRLRTATGPNASDSMHASQDPLLFQSVSAVQFIAGGHAMVSTGYDHYLRIWDLQSDHSSPRCKLAFKHRAEVDVMAVNAEGLIATGAKQFDDCSVKVIRPDLNFDSNTGDTSSSVVTNFYSPKALAYPNKEIHPVCLRWGSELYSQQKYLLCGFSSKLEDFGEGETCLWDLQAEKCVAITRGSRSVFDITWSPTTFGRFAVGSTRSADVNRGTNSVIRIFDSRYVHENPQSTMQVSGSRTCELECPARDMNDVVFNPTDEFLISAGCTDGSVYTWDIRNPDRILHRFSHGPAAMELDENASREDVDTGVRFLSWGPTRHSLYTGSSDGVVAQWDPYRSSEDAFSRKVAQLNSGIMCGSFSPDYSNLLFGEVNGSVMMLSVGQEDRTVRECERFEIQPAGRNTLEEVYDSLGISSSRLEKDKAPAQSTAKELIESGQIEIRLFGDLPFRQAVQGPMYSGPYDQSLESKELRLQAEHFQKRFKQSEPSGTANLGRQSIITEEELGDSGAWKYRIPHNLRTEAPKMCSSQRRLECFRCGNTLDLVLRPTETVSCSNCKRAWRMNCLGYTPIPRRQLKSTSAAEDSTELDRNRASKGANDDEDMNLMHQLEQERAELQDIESYYHGLWSMDQIL